MAAEIVQIDTQNFTSQTYGGQDTNLISSFEVNTSLSSSSYIEYFVYDNNQNILSTDYNFIQYTVLADGQSAGSNNTISQIIIDPEKSLADLGYSQGEYVAYFNFFNKQIGSNLQQLYITEISSDRTEIRLDSTNLTEFDIVEQTTSFIQQREDSPYFLDFYLNFGDNQLSIANNIQLDDQDPLDPTILIKLYEALPEEFDVNSTLWVVTLVEEPIAYQVIFPLEPIEIIDTINLKGPNFNLELKDQINNSTVSLDYTNLTTTSLTSSFNQLSSLLEEKEIDINIDYTNFNEFVHFSSVETRLENFYYKMSLLEDYSSSIAVLNTTTNNNPSASLTVYESLINNIITNFDGYEYYLYYSSGSWAWPKTTSQPPYQLATTGSVAVNTWYDNIIVSASNFDNTNQNNLYYAIPEYLRNDPANAPYQIFVEMMGQFYDNIWIYYKDVTQKYNADNRLEYGVSKDIVADAIRDFGIKLYQNNFSNDDLYTAFIGLTPQGGLFPFPNITGSLPTPSGFEYINTLISASNDYMPLDDVNKSLYKRIYHNLPYLLKAKGTIPGLRALITSYGVPDTVLRINEYGGKDKSNTNDWDYWENTFNYAYDTLGTNYITSSWETNNSWGGNNVPSTIQFRFKTNGIPVNKGYYSQSLWTTDQGVTIRLRYTGSGYTSGSYSGSIPNPYNEYAHLDFIPDTSSPAFSASVYLPFFNEDWWSVMATGYEGTYIFKLYAGNNVYDGGDNGTELGFYASSSISTNEAPWDNSTISYFPSTANSSFGKMFSGSYQEIRYFNIILSESIFKDYIMNPSSIEGNSLNSSPDQLIFRASLGGELYTGSKSIHPKVTGSWIPTSSFSTGNNFYISNTSSFVPNTEYFFYDQPAVGIKNAISDKIRLENSVIPSGNTLSPFRSLAQNTAASQSYTANTNLLEVAFSPQDEINQDIMDQIGYFNIGELIGDPRLRSSSATSYPALDDLRNEYFEKYTSNYDLNDYIRLIKFFDNSLFKMIKDFVPARASLASGVVIKQHLLERNKYPQPQVNTYSTIANIGVTNSSFTFLIPGNITTSGSIIYPITSSGIIGLSITGSITEDAIDSQYYIYLYSPTALLAILWDTTTGPFSTYPFSGSYSGPIPSGSYIEFFADPLSNNYQINNFTASLQFLIPSYTPYTTQDIAVSGTVAPQWNDYNPGTIENFSGGTGGTFEMFNGVSTSPYGLNGTGPENVFGVTQSWNEGFVTPLGIVNTIHNSQDEFYNGEFSGSVLLVTTQSLAQPYPLENLSFDYTPVIYSEGGYGFLNDLSDDPNPPFAENQFLNPLTLPNPGEILLLSPYFILGGISPGGSFLPNITGPVYVKIHKFDNNGVDNTIPLGQLTQLLIKYSTLPSYSTMTILTINEYSTYYLYEVNSLGTAAANLDNYILNYYTSASITTPYNLSTGNVKTITNWNNEIGDTLSYFNTSSGILTFENTPNIQISITSSLTTTGSIASVGKFSLIQLRNGVETIITQTNHDVSTLTTSTISSSLYPLETDQYYFTITRGSFNTGFLQISSSQLLITQSIAPSTAENDPIIIEPYITLPNYYNSDYNPLINNILVDRLSSIYQDVDYSTGIYTPTNFNLLISGSALKAAVQDSNYTSKRVILPRYEGSKSTSQHLNYWTPGDTGTYGKLPTIESLKTMVAYCSDIGGWPPERENASAAFIKYLIKADGTVIIPNTSPNSLTENKDTFETGENVLIQYSGTGNQATPIRKVIRGGTRIEPILYTQFGQAPGTTWNTTMSFEDIIPSAVGVNGDYTSTYNKNNSQTFTFTGATKVLFNNKVSGINLSSNSYPVPLGAVEDGVDLNVQVFLPIIFQWSSQNNGSCTFTPTLYVYKNSTPIYNHTFDNVTVSDQNDVSTITYTPPTPVTLNAGTFVQGDLISIYINLTRTNSNGIASLNLNLFNQFKITQYPAFTLPVTSSGTNSIWNWGNKTNYPYIITSSQVTLTSLYGDPNVKMVDITGSGFNKVELPWSIQYADEFKFEGNETYVYQVGKIFAPGDSGSGRIFPTGSIEVHFNNPLPVSASNFNLDHFAIRRYVDEASQILIEGFKPVGSSGPYILRPEYIVPELNKDIDDFILILKEKGLI